MRTAQWPLVVEQSSAPLIGNARINDAFPVALAEPFADRKRRSQEREGSAHALAVCR